MLRQVGSSSMKRRSMVAVNYSSSVRPPFMLALREPLGRSSIRRW
jgi:hypothetical protein